MLDISQITSSRSKRMSLIANIVIHSLYILSLPVWYFLSMFSVMLFDAPGSQRRLPIVAFYYALQCYPYTVIGAIVLAWLFYRKGFYRFTYPINFSPAAVMIVCTGLMALFDE